MRHHQLIQLVRVLAVLSFSWFALIAFSGKHAVAFVVCAFGSFGLGLLVAVVVQNRSSFARSSVRRLLRLPVLGVWIALSVVLLGKSNDGGFVMLSAVLMGTSVGAVAVLAIKARGLGALPERRQQRRGRPQLVAGWFMAAALVTYGAVLAAAPHDMLPVYAGLAFLVVAGCAYAITHRRRRDESSNRVD
jgi:hypothetical protein